MLNKKIDLLIIDIDNTLIKHRTVMLANRILLNYFCEKREYPNLSDTIKKSYKLFFCNKYKKQQLILIFVGIRLYLYYFMREFLNKFNFKISSKWMIKEWAETIIKLKVKQKEYNITYRTLNKYINKDLLEVIRKIEPKNIITISEHFVVGKDPIEQILKCKNFSNEFFVKEGDISSYKINISCSKDKLKIAKEQIKKLNAKKIGVIIDDYDDLDLLKLNPIVIIALKKLKRNIVNTSSDFIQFYE